MKKTWIAALAAMSLFFAMSACAEEAALPGAKPDAAATPVAEAAVVETAAAEEIEEEDVPNLKVTTKSRWFVNKYKRTYARKISYYENVYAYNHGKYVSTSFDAKVPAKYFVIDEEGGYALAPIVLDITDAMRVRLYGADVGETYMYYGQFSTLEKAVYQEEGKRGYHRYGIPGIHEGIDFVNRANCPLYAILGGEVTRAGDADGTVAIYNEEYDCTVLYLHTVNICVKKGDVVKAGTQIAKEGKKNAGTVYTHVELRNGRHEAASKWRNSRLESDCPYPVMQAALGVVESGRQPVTAAAVNAAQRMREEAEAALLALEAEENIEPEIELVDNLPGTEAGYGFTEEAQTVVPEATLPPSK
ncbi:MAG: M23 family metallopeptidase [Eubacteriales bacterium]|nr:M23 family metallopeptidase [Eubacteriales bacterium]